MKIRTDFVTNSSSSSYVALNVGLKNGNTLYAYWNSGNIDMDFVPSIELTKEDYLSLKTGADLLSICYAYSDNIYAKWAKSHDAKRDGYSTNVNEIAAIKDVQSEVAWISIESYLEVIEPMYEATDRFNFRTGKHSYKDKLAHNVNKNIKKKEVKTITFDDDIYDPKVEQKIIERCDELTEGQLSYVISELKASNRFKHINKTDYGKELYKVIANLFLKKKYSLRTLHSIKAYTNYINEDVEYYDLLQKVKSAFSYPDELVCEGLTFVTTYLEPYQEHKVSVEISKRGGVLKNAISGKTNVLIAIDDKPSGVKLEKAIEYKEQGKNIIIITMAHFESLIKQEKLK